MNVAEEIELTIEAQPGPQYQFLACEADISLYGGAAGGGKSYGLLLDALRFHENPLYRAVIFRRELPMIMNPGALWDEANSLYPLFGAVSQNKYLRWIFPSGAQIRFAHLFEERDKLAWQGSQLPYFGFDEITHFSETQFFYMFSRLRSASGIPGHIRATCNPDSDSWVRRLIDWYIGDDGYPIQNRAGKVRWFIRDNDAMVWADSREELIKKHGAHQLPKSFTFIPSKVHDNKILLSKDPSYLSNLMALPRVERMRLEGGNWDVKAAAGEVFKREWFEIIDAIPAGFIKVVRYWDRAATKPNEGNKDPDWTRGLLLYKYPNGIFVVADLKSERDTPAKVEQLIRNTASFDTHSVTIYLEQDPGASGVADVNNLVRMLSGFDVRITKPSVKKEVRARPVSAQAEVGNIKILRAPWNKTLLDELENFPEGAHDDIVDTLSGAFNECATNASIFDVL